MRNPRFGNAAVLIGLFSILSATLPLAADDRAEFFETRIRPVLIGTCFKCHGGDKTSSGLRVDAAEHLTRGGDSGVAVVPGKPEESLLLTAIRYTDDNLKMPPKERLPDRVIEDFEKWIADGASWPAAGSPVDTDAGRHWAFQPINKDASAAPGESTYSHPIDRFLEGAHRERGLSPLGPADRLALIRRASFDLTGLPPAPDDVRAFMDDGRPDAFARAVDRLLDSPRYGERWARHWLDLVRYADTAGDDSDYPIPQAVLYRDYVIDSFNADKPYDAFIREQIAGDLLASDRAAEDFRERTIATGFLAQAKRFGTYKHEDMELIIEDTLNTIGQAVLGLTFRCARCHDHKYDPLKQEDYYALYGIFQSTVYPHPGGEADQQPSDLIPLVDREEFARAEATFRAEYGDRVAELEAEIKQIEERTKDARERRTLVQQLRAKLREIRRHDPWQTTPLAYAVKDGKPVDARIQIGGDPKSLSEQVRRGVPRFLAPDGPLELAAGQSGRRELAEWLTSPKNPLTARVMVNRIWQYHFGKGIVSSPSNFGVQGDPPTHPKLLDWLASEFIESGWSFKAMHRLMMTSAAYQRTSGHDNVNNEVDPENRYYWRFDRRCLDAEAIRDSMLLIAGNLDFCRSGPHPFPAADGWRFSAHRQFKAVYPSNLRSIYLMVQRLHDHPFLSIFNGASTTASVAVRDTSTLPSQALFMANSEFVHEQADGLARRLIESKADARTRVAQAHWLVFSRPATDGELERGLEYLENYARILTEEGSSAEELAVGPLASLARTMFAANEFAYID